MSDVVVLTRRAEDTAALAAVLHTRGLDVIELPCVRTEPLSDAGPLVAALAVLTRADLLVLTSRAGVDAVARVLGHRTLPCFVAAIGPTTAARAREAGFEVLLTPHSADSRMLGEQLPIPEGRIVLARSDLADDDLPHVLRTRGADVIDVVAYRTIGEVGGDVAPVLAALVTRDVTIVFASPSAVSALADAVGPAVLRRARFVAFGQRTALAVRELIGAPALVPDALDSASLARAIMSGSFVSIR